MLVSVVHFTLEPPILVKGELKVWKIWGVGLAHSSIHLDFVKFLLQIHG